MPAGGGDAAEREAGEHGQDLDEAAFTDGRPGGLGLREDEVALGHGRDQAAKQAEEHRRHQLPKQRGLAGEQEDGEDPDDQDRQEREQERGLPRPVE